MPNYKEAYHNLITSLNHLALTDSDRTKLAMWRNEIEPLLAAGKLNHLQACKHILRAFGNRETEGNAGLPRRLNASKKLLH